MATSDITRSGTSPIGTYSANSGATAATNSSYGIGAYTSGVTVKSTTAYKLNDTDYQGIILFNSASDVTVTLNSAVKSNFQATILNIGTGKITLTTSDGSGINNGGSSMTLDSKQGCQVFYSLRAWALYAGTTVFQVVPATIGPTAHEWINSYDSATGAFTLAQPDYSDLTGKPTLPSDATATPHRWVNSYTASTGAFTETQPDFTDVSGNLATTQLPTAGISATITTAALTSTGTQGSMTFTNGILTAQTPAT